MTNEIRHADMVSVAGTYGNASYVNEVAPCNKHNPQKAIGFISSQRNKNRHVCQAPDECYPTPR